MAASGGGTFPGPVVGLGVGIGATGCGWTCVAGQPPGTSIPGCTRVRPQGRGCCPAVSVDCRLCSPCLWAEEGRASRHPGARESEARPGLGPGGSGQRPGMAAGPGALRSAAGGRRGLPARGPRAALPAERAGHEGLTPFFYEKRALPREPGLVCADKLRCGGTSPGMRRPGCPIHGRSPVHSSPRCAGPGARCHEPQ